MEQPSRNVVEKVQIVFAPDEQVQALATLVNECAGNLPMVESNPELIERIQIAVIKLSGGRVDVLCRWVGQAQEDWRDVLDAAGFYKDERAHLAWKP
jgi:hypothetical protein